MGSSSVAVILLLCRKSLKIHKLENTTYIFILSVVSQWKMCLNPCLAILVQQTLSNLKQDPVALVVFLSLKRLRLDYTLTQVVVCVCVDFCG